MTYRFEEFASLQEVHDDSVMIYNYERMIEKLSHCSSAQTVRISSVTLLAVAFLLFISV
jgi:hypothetical protein